MKRPEDARIVERLRKLVGSTVRDPALSAEFLDDLQVLEELLAQRELLLSDRERLREDRRDLVASLTRQELLGALARQGLFVLGSTPQIPYCGCPSCEGRHLTTEAPQVRRRASARRGFESPLSRPLPEAP